MQQWQIGSYRWPVGPGGGSRIREQHGRVAHELVIDATIASWIAARDGADALRALEQADVPCSPSCSIAEIMADRHFAARDMRLRTTLPDGTEIAMPRVASKLSATPGGMETIGRDLGAHTDDVIAGLGYEAGERDALRRWGII